LCAMVNAQIVKATGINHEQIGYTRAGVAQDVFGTATAFDATQGMLHPDSHACK
jgi:hypothetical protein